MFLYALRKNISENERAEFERLSTPVYTIELILQQLNHFLIQYLPNLASENVAVLNSYLYDKSISEIMSLEQWIASLPGHEQVEFYEKNILALNKFDLLNILAALKDLIKLQSFSNYFCDDTYKYNNSLIIIRELITKLTDTINITAASKLEFIYGYLKNFFFMPADASKRLNLTEYFRIHDDLLNAMPASIKSTLMSTTNFKSSYYPYVDFPEIDAAFKQEAGPITLSIEKQFLTGTYQFFSNLRDILVLSLCPPYIQQLVSSLQAKTGYQLIHRVQPIIIGKSKSATFKHFRIYQACLDFLERSSVQTTTFLIKLLKTECDAIENATKLSRILLLAGVTDEVEFLPKIIEAFLSLLDYVYHNEKTKIDYEKSVIKNENGYFVQAIFIKQLIFKNFKRIFSPATVIEFDFPASHSALNQVLNLEKKLGKTGKEFIIFQNDYLLNLPDLGWVYFSQLFYRALNEIKFQYSSYQDYKSDLHYIGEKIARSIELILAREDEKALYSATLQDINRLPDLQIGKQSFANMNLELDNPLFQEILDEWPRNFNLDLSAPENRKLLDLLFSIPDEAAQYNRELAGSSIHIEPKLREVIINGQPQYLQNLLRQMYERRYITSEKARMNLLNKISSNVSPKYRKFIELMFNQSGIISHNGFFKCLIEQITNAASNPVNAISLDQAALSATEKHGMLMITFTHQIKILGDADAMYNNKLRNEQITMLNMNKLCFTTIFEIHAVSNSKFKIANCRIKFLPGQLIYLLHTKLYYTISDWVTAFSINDLKLADQEIQGFKSGKITSPSEFNSIYLLLYPAAASRFKFARPSSAALPNKHIEPNRPLMNSASAIAGGKLPQAAVKPLIYIFVAPTHTRNEDSYWNYSTQQSFYYEIVKILIASTAAEKNTFFLPQAGYEAVQPQFFVDTIEDEYFLAQTSNYKYALQKSKIAQVLALNKAAIILSDFNFANSLIAAFEKSEFKELYRATLVLPAVESEISRSEFLCVPHLCDLPLDVANIGWVDDNMTLLRYHMEQYHFILKEEEYFPDVKQVSQADRLRKLLIENILSDDLDGRPNRGKFEWKKDFTTIKLREIIINNVRSIYKQRFKEQLQETFNLQRRHSLDAHSSPQPRGRSNSLPNDMDGGSLIGSQF